MAPVRRQFKGVMEVNEETGKEDIIHSSVAAKFTKLAASTSFTAALIFAVMFVSFLATLVAYDIKMRTKLPGSHACQ